MKKSINIFYNVAKKTWVARSTRTELAARRCGGSAGERQAWTLGCASSKLAACSLGCVQPAASLLLRLQAAKGCASAVCGKRALAAHPYFKGRLFCASKRQARCVAACSLGPQALSSKLAARRWLLAACAASEPWGAQARYAASLALGREPPGLACWTSSQLGCASALNVVSCRRTII